MLVITFGQHRIPFFEANNTSCDSHFSFWKIITFLKFHRFWLIKLIKLKSFYYNNVKKYIFLCGPLLKKLKFYKASTNTVNRNRKQNVMWQLASWRYRLCDKVVSKKNLSAKKAIFKGKENFIDFSEKVLKIQKMKCPKWIASCPATVNQVEDLLKRKQRRRQSYKRNLALCISMMCDLNIFFNLQTKLSILELTNLLVSYNVFFSVFLDPNKSKLIFFTYIFLKNIQKFGKISFDTTRVWNVLKIYAAVVTRVALKLENCLDIPKAYLLK